MCYSANIELELEALRHWGAVIDEMEFEDLFSQRVTNSAIKIPKGLEANFYQPKTASEGRIRSYIDQYHAQVTQQYEKELFVQAKRLADAERTLLTKQTKKALADQRIATSKIESFKRRLADVKRAELKPGDSRIFPMMYAPVIVMENGKYLIKPMRYHCRQNGKPATIDQRYDGLYNARRDSLEDYWRGLYGRHHAVCVVSSFYENVKRHTFEHRALRPGENEENMVLHYNPQAPMPMLLACMWDRWQEPGQADLLSFTAITDEPPPEIAATGHDRCVIPLTEANMRAWLDPAGRTKDALYQLLDERERPYYEHRQAA